MYIARCFAIIKDHKSFSHFKEEGKGEKQLFDYSEEVGVHIEVDFNVPEEVKWEGKHLQEAFWKVFEVANYGRPIERILCSTLYIAGFTLIGIVLYQNLDVVVAMAF